MIKNSYRPIKPQNKTASKTGLNRSQINHNLQLVAEGIGEIEIIRQEETKMANNKEEIAHKETTKEDNSIQMDSGITDMATIRIQREKDNLGEISIETSTIVAEAALEEETGAAEEVSTGAIETNKEVLIMDIPTQTETSKTEGAEETDRKDREGFHKAIITETFRTNLTCQTRTTKSQSITRCQ